MMLAGVETKMTRTPKSEDEGEPFQIKTLQETIDKLKSNGYQYCSAGDARRLIRRIEELEREDKLNKSGV